jgi:hypothetical protein
MVNETEKRKKILLKKQKNLLKRLSEIGPFVSGSVTIVKRICGNKACQCRKNKQKKHPAMFLTWKENKKTKALYIPVAMYDDVKTWNNNYKKLKTIINKMSDIQKELLKLR